ncbi:ParB/RepB/Spo0J family partition protein, partial [Alteromonas sp. 14N.309.X.WAT.G.H12]|uniref:ParB/RepB/Spo0J family partition protein n=1 Tax=Alteromonas sp. 14N.309.X.WAT.G.H12 TaxID=3120824 RepID=UPI002FD71E8A
MTLKVRNLQGLKEAALKNINQKTKEVLTVSVNDVVSKKQVRKEFDELEGLAQTMLVEGQQTPIIVGPKNKDGKYVIQKGERRWRALKLAKIDEIDIIVNTKEQSKSDEIIGELIENIQRENLKPMEEAEGIRDALEADPSLTKSALAERLGKSNAYISQHLALLKMPACVRHIYDIGVSRDPETLNNLRQLSELDQQRCESVCEIAIKSGITRKASRDILNDARTMRGSQQ